MLGVWGVGCRDCGLLKCKLGLGGAQGQREGASTVRQGPASYWDMACRHQLSGGAPQPAAPAAQLHGLSLTLRWLATLSRAGQHRRTGFQTPPMPHTRSRSSGISSLSCFGTSSALSQPHSRDLVPGPQAACVHGVSDGDPEARMFLFVAL